MKTMDNKVFDLDKMSSMDVQDVIEEAHNNFFYHDVQILLTAILELRKHDPNMSSSLADNLDYMERKLSRLAKRLPASLVAYGDFNPKRKKDGGDNWFIKAS